MNKNGYIFIFLCVGVFIVGLSGCLFDKAVEDIAHQEVLKQYGSIAVNLKFDHKKIALKAPDGVETIRLVVSGLDMVPMTSEFSASLEEGVVDEIPVGNTRMIIATGLDSSGLILYQSISYADVTPNTQSIVDIDLLSISSLTIPPEVVSVTANFPDGFFKAESIIDIIIEFSQVVDVTGIPQLDLADSIGKIDFVSGSGTKELIFQYTVGAGQNCTDLDYVGSGSLTLNGGTIQNGGEVNALLTLSEPGTAGSLGDAVNIVIDTIAPFINVDNIVVNNTVLPNTITVTFSEKIDSTAAEVVGYWVLAYTSDEITYSLSSAVLDPDGKTVTLTLITPSSSDFRSYITTAAALGHLTLTPSTSITDLAKNSYAAGALIEAGVTHILDTTVPTVVTVHTLDVNENGKIDTIEIEFSEAVQDSKFTGNIADWLLDQTGIGDWGNLVTFDTSTSSVAISDTADDKYVKLGITELGSYTTTGPINYQYIGTAIVDFAGNALAAITSSTAVDKAAPVLAGVVAENTSGGQIGQIETGDSIKLVYTETMSDPSAFEAIGDVICSADTPTSIFTINGFGNMITDNAYAGTPISTGSSSTYSLETSEGGNANDTIIVTFGNIGPLLYSIDSLGNGITFSGTQFFEDIAGNSAIIFILVSSGSF